MLQTWAKIFVFVVALLHLLIATVEIFLWRHPLVWRRLERLRLTQEEAGRIAPIIANAGLYNGFIGTGLIWAAVTRGSGDAVVFFLLCVIIAEIVGAITLKPTTLLLAVYASNCCIVARLDVKRRGIEGLEN